MGSRWIPRIPNPGAAQGPPPPPQEQDHQAPKYIVGNEVAGDTIFVCDFLDPGDGTGVAAAIAAATAVHGDIWVRPGTYNFALAGSPVMPLTVPQNVTLRGASRTLTIFAGDDDIQQDMFVLSASAAIEEVQFTVPASAGAAAGQGIIQLSGVLSVLRGCIINMTSTPLTTQIAVSTGTSAANGCVVEDCDVHMPSTRSPDPGSPFVGVIFGTSAAQSPFANGGPIARDLRLFGGEFPLVFLSVGGGIADCITVLGHVTSTGNAGIVWTLRESTATNVPGCRITNVVYTSDTGENASFSIAAVSIQTAVPGVTTVVATGFEIANILVRFARGGTPSADRLGVDIDAADDGGRSVITNVNVTNVNVSGHTTGVRVKSGTTSAVANVGEARNINISAVNAPAAAAAGLNPARGIDLQVATPAIGDKIKRVNIVGCDFAVVPAAGVGVNIGAQVNNTIVVANQISPAGGTAIVDLGSGTELGHNIVT